MSEQPTWGTPPQERYYPPEKGAPPMQPAPHQVPQVQFAVGGPLDPLALRRRATTALIVNLVLVLFGGLLSIPGAVFAAMSLSETQNPERARRLLKWSWGFLAANLLFFVLLVITLVLIALFLFLAATN